MLEEAFAAADVTGRAQAHEQVVLAPGLETEGLVEAGNLIHLDGRHADLVRHPLERFLREVEELVLNIQQEGDQRMAVRPVLVDDLVHLRQFDSHTTSP